MHSQVFVLRVTRILQSGVRLEASIEAAVMSQDKMALNSKIKSAALVLIQLQLSVSKAS